MTALLATGLVLPGCRDSSLPEEAAAPDPVALAAVHLSADVLPGTAEIAPLLVRTLEANRRELQGQTGKIEGFGAGEAYPQVWLRDSATLVPFSRFVYPREAMVSWLEEHLSHQRRSGELFDWIAAGRREAFAQNAPLCVQVYRAGDKVLTADKNTTAADQETSAVHAAYLYVAATGDADWLAERVMGRPVLDRLDAALEFLFRDRFDERLGLVRNAFTADWGDVGPVYPDQRAIYLDEFTPLVAGIYVNAVACRGAEEMAALLAAGGRPDRAEVWTARAAGLKAAALRHLWDEGRGFFRIHVRAGGPTLDYDDSDMFALGGNALAVLAGLAGEGRDSRIFAAAERRRKDYEMPTIAGVLLPPYRTGVFHHPILTEAWTYQNGGQWDWWGGPFVVAEFEGGHARAALVHLGQILARVEETGGLYEWATREGEGKGSAMYAGSAAAIGQALVEGAFGVSLRHDALEIHARVCDAEASIALHEPTTGTRVSYSCEPTAAGVAVSFDTEGAAPGSLCVLLPEGRGAVEARREDAVVPVVALENGLDRYACVRTDWGRGAVSFVLDP